MNIDTKQKYCTDGYWTSNYNYLPELQQGINPPKKVIIHDATLRDGEQTPGIVLRKNEKIEIAEMLDDIGVHRIEAGMPAVSEEDAQAVTEIVKRVRRAKVFAFVRAMPGDIEQAYNCGAQGVIIEVPIGLPKLKYQFNWTWEEVFRRSVTTVKRAKELGLYTVFFPYDTTRAEWSDMENLMKKLMEEAPPDSVGVIDTTGCITPRAYGHLVAKVKNLTGLPVEAHTHNDIGMAVANEMAAIEAGAEVVHTCVNGIGERTGNAALEEVVVALKTLYGYDMEFKFNKLRELSATVERLTGFKLAPNKPIVGSGNFVRESGIGIDMVYKHPLAMFSLNPTFVGQEPKAVLGKKSGLASVQIKLDEMGLSAEKAQMEVLLKQIKQLGSEKKDLVSDDEFRQIFNNVICG